MASTLGGWTAPTSTKRSVHPLGGIFGRPFDLLLGRQTYSILAAHWPYVTDPNERLPASSFQVIKYVASRVQAKAVWQNSQLPGQDIIASLKKLKGEDGPDRLVQGSGTCSPTLVEGTTLVDEFSVLNLPGGPLRRMGKRVFGDGAIPAGLAIGRSHPVLPYWRDRGELRSAPAR